MLAYFAVPVGWAEIFKRTFSATNKDDMLEFAAALAYSFFFALFPALIFVIALASFFPLHGLIDQLQSQAGTVAPKQMMDLVAPQIAKLSNSHNSGLLTFGILITLFSASSGMTSVMDALNHAYDITEGRSWWKVRLTAVGLVVVLGIFTLISFGLVMVGPMLAGHVANAVGLGSAFTLAWRIVEWPVAFVLIAVGIGIVYYAAPDADQEWVWITPGSLLATVLWLLASLGFRVYISHFNSYESTYGALGGVMIALLWLYITGVVLLIGAEMNAEIEHASPYGKEPGEKKPEERKKIGLAARRAYEEQRQLQGGTPALAPAAAMQANCDVDKPTPAHPVQPVVSRAPAHAGVSRFVLAGIVAGEFAMAVWSKIRRTKA